jgi:hypothetical protein
MPFILLTGAGFTHNWGGWLADEVIEFLIGSARLSPSIRDLLWNGKEKGGGFEQALSNSTGQDRVTLEEAIVEMFDTMNGGLSKRTFDDSNDRERRLAPFLLRFDAIFTLNQDLLLEEHYLNASPELDSPHKWSGTEIPGVRPIHPTQGKRYLDLHEPSDSNDFKLRKMVQPYFKLHGSSNWRDQSRGRLLIMGGAKPSAIGQSELLTWYWTQFHTFLNMKDARLMVIGYGFGDQHVNKELEDAAGRHLRIFVVDPRGADVFDQRSPKALIREAATPLMSQMRSILVGASRRPLRQTLASDDVEFAKINRFFAP